MEFDKDIPTAGDENPDAEEVRPDLDDWTPEVDEAEPDTDALLAEVEVPVPHVSKAFSRVVQREVATSLPKDPAEHKAKESMTEKILRKTSQRPTAALTVSELRFLYGFDVPDDDEQESDGRLAELSHKRVLIRDFAKIYESRDNDPSVLQAQLIADGGERVVLESLHRREKGFHIADTTEFALHLIRQGNAGLIFVYHKELWGADSHVLAAQLMQTEENENRLLRNLHMFADLPRAMAQRLVSKLDVASLAKNLPSFDELDGSLAHQMLDVTAQPLTEEEQKLANDVGEAVLANLMHFVDIDQGLLFTQYAQSGRAKLLGEYVSGRKRAWPGSPNAAFFNYWTRHARYLRGGY